MNDNLSQPNIQKEAPTTTVWGLSWPALTADAIGMLALILTLPLLKEQFETIPIRGASILLGLFFLMGIAVNRLKRLEPQASDTADLATKLNFTHNQTIVTLLGIAAGHVFVFIQADLNQITNDLVALYGRDGYVHEGEITLYYSLGPTFMWFMVAAFYQAAFMLKTERRIAAYTQTYQITEVLALTAINLYLVGFAGYLAAVGSTWFSSPVLFLIVAFILIELVFDPARLRHTIKNPQWALTRLIYPVSIDRPHPHYGLIAETQEKPPHLGRAFAPTPPPLLN